MTVKAEAGGEPHTNSFMVSVTSVGLPGSNKPLSDGHKILRGGLAGPQREHDAEHGHPLQRPTTTSRENRSGTHFVISLGESVL